MQQKTVEHTMTNFFAFFWSKVDKKTPQCVPAPQLQLQRKSLRSLTSPSSCRVIIPTHKKHDVCFLLAAAAALRLFQRRLKYNCFWWIEKIFLIQKSMPCFGSPVLLGLKQRYFPSNFFRKTFFFQTGRHTEEGSASWKHWTSEIRGRCEFNGEQNKNVTTK
jgi:hypothetical protein